MSRAIRFILALALLVPTLAAGAVAQARGAPDSGAAAQSGAIPAAVMLAGRNNDFGLSLFRALYAASAGQNVFLSPTSVSLALEMAYDGARAGTASGMAKALRLQGLPSGTVRSQAKSLLASLKSTDAHEGLTVADSLWARSGVPFRSQFLQHARAAYAATVRSLDFRSPSAPAAINAWVDRATHGTIPTMVDSIPPNVILYLLNAVYFQGAWSVPFNPGLTHSAPFTLPSGSQTQVPMMAQTSDFAYASTKDVQMVRLPYGKGRFSAVIALPRGGIGAVAGHLTAATWRSWISQMKFQYGSITLPRVNLAMDVQLNRSLSALGMGAAFSDGADFSGMCVKPCRLSFVRHRTYLKVDEKGTVASAATAVGVVPTAVQQQQFQMIVDRPFLMSIEDSRTGAILFFGAVENPSGH